MNSLLIGRHTHQSQMLWVKSLTWGADFVFGLHCSTSLSSYYSRVIFVDSVTILFLPFFLDWFDNLNHFKENLALMYLKVPLSLNQPTSQPHHKDMIVPHTRSWTVHYSPCSFHVLEHAAVSSHSSCNQWKSGCRPGSLCKLAHGRRLWELGLSGTVQMLDLIDSLLLSVIWVLHDGFDL